MMKEADMLKHIERMQPMLDQLERLKQSGLMSEQIYDTINRIDYYKLNEYSNECITENKLENLADRILDKVEKFSK